MQKIGMTVLLSLLTLIPVTARHSPAAALEDARVLIFPTDDPQAIVDANPAGTHFVIKARTHSSFPGHRAR